MAVIGGSKSPSGAGSIEQFSNTDTAKICIIPRFSKKWATFIVMITFGNSGPIFVLISLLNSENICVGRWN